MGDLSIVGEVPLPDEGKGLSIVGEVDLSPKGMGLPNGYEQMAQWGLQHAQTVGSYAADKDWGSYERMVHNENKRLLKRNPQPIDPPQQQFSAVTDSGLTGNPSDKEVTKLPSQFLGEGAAFVGSVVPMAATYIAYNQGLQRGLTHEQAYAYAMHSREQLDPGMGLGHLADLMGVDKSWIQSPQFQEAMQSFHENAIKPGSDKYFPEEGLGKTLYEDFAYLVAGGTAMKGAHMALPKARTSAGDKARAAMEQMKAEYRDQRYSDSQVDTMDSEGGNQPGVTKPDLTIADEFPLDDNFKVPRSLDESQAAATHEIDSQQGLQQPGTPDGWDPRLTTKEPTGKAYPTIMEEFKLPPGEDERIANDPTIKNAAYPPIENGFGKDVEGSSFNAPQFGVHDPLREQMKANNEPAHGKMEFPDSPGPFRLGGEDVTHKMKDLAHTEQDSELAGHPEWIKAIARAKNLSEALSAVADHPDLPPQLKGIAETLKKYAEGVGFEIGTQNSHPKLAGTAGIISTNKTTGKRTVWATVDRGVSPRTILHEAMHAADTDAFNIASTPELAKQGKYRKQVTYAKEMDDIWQVVKDHFDSGKGPKLPEDLKAELDYALETPAEFTAQVKAFPELRAMLKDIDIANVSALDRVKNAVYKFLGLDSKIKHNNIADRFLFNEDQLSKHQHINDAMRAEMVQKFGKGDTFASKEFKSNNFETWDRITGEFIGKPGDILHFTDGAGKPIPFKVDKVYVGDGTMKAIKVRGRLLNPYTNEWDRFSTSIAAYELAEPTKLLGHDITLDSLVKRATDRLSGPDLTTPKQDLTPAEKGWTNITKQGLGLKGPGKSQAGSIDVGAISQSIADATKWLLGTTDKAAAEFDRKLTAHFGPLRDADEMKRFAANLTQHQIDTGDVKDLPGIGAKGKDGSTIKPAGAGMQQNQLMTTADHNPMISSIVNVLKRAGEQAQIRIGMYDKMTEKGLDWFTKNVKDGVDFFREWERLNVLPELRSAREQIEKGGPKALKEWFTQNGVKPEAVDALQPFMEVLRHVEGSDSHFLQQYGRPLNHEPLYWTLNRTGPYHFQVHNEAGQVKLAQGFETLREAKKYQQIFKEGAEKGWTVGEVFQTDPSRAINSVMVDALVQGAPAWLRDLVYKNYTSRIEWERNFELNRASDRRIGGYIGEIAPKTDADFRDQAAKYLQSFAHRIRESHHLENSSAAVEIATKVLMDKDNPLQAKLPNTFAWAHDVLARHIGVDLSLEKNSIDRFQQGTAEAIGRVLTHIDSVFNNYEVGKNDNVFGPRAAHTFWQRASYAASMMKIVAAPATNAANLIQNGYISMEGVRHAARTGVGMQHAIKAQVQQLAFLAHPEAFPEVKAFMEQAKREGIIDPHGREDFSAIEGQDNTGKNPPVIDLLQKPRDWIEMGTNYWTLAYTKFFVDSAYPHLTEAQKKATTYTMMHSFTGDYSQLAHMMAFDKAGAIGHSQSTFSKWKFNRIGRYIDDLAFIAKIPEIGPRALLPILATTMIGFTTAGVYGGVGVVDYEALRKLGQVTGWWDWRPASAWISKVAPNLKEWQKRGFVQGISDEIAQHYFGQSSGPDISGNLRESSPLEVSSVTFSVLLDAIKDVGIGIKYLSSREDVDAFMQKIPGWNKTWDSLKAKGISSDDDKQLINSMPTFVKGPLQDSLLIPHIGPDGQMTYTVPELKKDQGMYTRNQFQRNLARATNLRTADESNNAEARSFSEWSKRQKANDLKTLKDGLEKAVMDEDPSHEWRIEENRTAIFANHGKQAYEAVITDIKHKIAEYENTDYRGNEMLRISHMRDAQAMRRNVERMEQFDTIAASKAK